MTEKAMSILNNPYLNKGTAFTKAERDQLGLNGLIPPYLQTLDEQVAQTYAQFQTKANDLEKRLFLMQISMKTGYYSTSCSVNTLLNLCQLFTILPLRIRSKTTVSFMFNHKTQLSFPLMIQITWKRR